MLSFSCYPWALYLLPMDVVEGLLRLLLAQEHGGIMVWRFRFRALDQ